jgi:hypothetical protein
VKLFVLTAARQRAKVASCFDRFRFSSVERSRAQLGMTSPINPFEVPGDSSVEILWFHLDLTEDAKQVLAF